MSSFNANLEECINKIRSSFYEQNANQINENDMWMLIENLIKEIDILKEETDVLKRNLKSFIESDSSKLTTKYIELKEKCENFQKQNADFETELEDLRLQNALELVTLKDEHSRIIAELENVYKQEIMHLKNLIDSEKAHREKKRELYDELQLAQATTALQCDEIESNLKRQLVDSNCKLRHSQNTIRSLQIELNNVKNQISYQYTSSLHKQSKSDLKYRPLAISSNNTSSGEIEELDFVGPACPSSRHCRSPQQHCLVFKGIETPIKKKQMVLPPKQDTPGSVNKNPNKSVQKKRKLYNPEDYLESLREDK